MATFRAVGFRAITFTLILVIPNSLQDYPNIIVALEDYRVKRCATSCPGDWLVTPSLASTACGYLDRVMRF
jgi:hypothetical protein